ncbi:hypothetical protein KY345_02930 [Candidatus Woesearchaeota archaeon]|nr:hypothetical protein [Candidatus Woesearchaeota archaeon]
MKLKKTSFFEAKELIVKNKKRSFYILCLDILFFGILLLVRSFLLRRMPEPYQIYGMDTMILLSFTLSYFAFLLLFYSLIKYMLLLVIKSMDRKASFTIKDYFRFILLNLIITGVVFLVLGVFGLIMNLIVKPESLSVVSTVLVVVIGLFSYFYLNVVHILFMLNNWIWKSVKRGFAVIFKKGDIYFPVMLNIVIVIIIYLIIYFPISLVFMRIQQTQTTVLVFRVMLNTIAVIFLYALLFFNRIQLFVKLKE